MIEITKEGNEHYPDIRISNSERSFVIKRENAPDPYWVPDFHPLKDNDDITFIINETDGEVYNIFAMLYCDVIAVNIFSLEKRDVQNKSEDEIKRLKRENYKQKKANQKLAQDTGLVKDNIIYWHSEDYDTFEASAVLKIKMYERKVEITFSKNKKHEDFPYYYPTYAIRISESSSIYQNFFYLFVRLHRQLQLLEREKTNFECKGTSECPILLKKRNNKRL